MSEKRLWSIVSFCLLSLVSLPARSAVDPKTIVRPALLLLKSVTINPTTVTGGSTVSGVVTINNNAMAVQSVNAMASQSVTVKITSSAPQIAEVPQSVTIQPGSTSATFIVQTHPVWINPSAVTPPPTVKISAQIGNDAPVVATLTVLPPALASLTINPTTVAGGTNATGTLTLTGPAPSAGLAITLNMSSGKPDRPIGHILTSGIGFPAQANIPAGATSGTFTVTTHPVAASVTYQINAVWGAFVTKTATVTVTPPDVSVFTPTYLGATAGHGFSATINLTGPAPTGGMIVNMHTALASGGTTGTFAQCGSLPNVPATVTVPAGATSAEFTGTTSPGYGTFWVIASTPTKTVMMGLSVMSAYFKVVLPASIKGGTPVQGKIQLNGPAMAPACGNRYTLTSSNTNYAQVPPFVDVTPGTTEAVFSMTTSALAASSPPVTVTITASGTAVGENAPAGPHVSTNTATMSITP